MRASAAAWSVIWFESLVAEAIWVRLLMIATARMRRKAKGIHDVARLAAQAVTVVCRLSTSGAAVQNHVASASDKTKQMRGLHLLIPKCSSRGACFAATSDPARRSLAYGPTPTRDRSQTLSAGALAIQDGGAINELKTFAKNRTNRKVGGKNNFARRTNGLTRNALSSSAADAVSRDAV